jgi:hypothetical protein
MGEEIKVCKVLVGKPEGKTPLGRLRHRWLDGIRMDLREIGGELFGSGQGPVAGSYEHLRVLAPRSRLVKKLT